MASKADRARARRARTIKAAQAARAKPTGPAAAAAAQAKPAPATRAARSPTTTHHRREDGLDMLLHKGRITRPQADAGRWYGAIWRADQLAGDAPIRAVDLAGAGGGGAGGAAAPELELDHAIWIADSRAFLGQARQALGDHEEMIAVLNLICGAGMHPREITTQQRATEQIETALRLGLDIILRRFPAEIRHMRYLVASAG